MIWECEYAWLDISRVANDLRTWGGGVARWLLYGPLGAGKTSLVRAWLGPEVHSPTFTYIHTYAEGVYHIDLYRVGSEDWARWEAIYEIIDTAHLVFVEWPERLPWPVPLPHVKVYLSIISSQARHLTAQMITADYQSDEPPPHTPP